MKLDLLSIILGVTAALVIYNVFSLVRAVMQRRKMQAELAKMQGKIEEVKKEIDIKKKELLDRIKNQPDIPDGKPSQN